eukprot:TRINITY_DN10984_c0_g1_i1.p1 TRINITY_DN10984_c0_g1~~TRINITY_DN10984_c0_g1_i1.p1  ORF type:complete len:299 (+),score=62.33 TRINITY_DN10984_c0_g1_i1:319-1215(+)
MGQEFLVEEVYPISFAVFTRLFFGDPSFKKEFHEGRNDEGIIVSDWIQVEPGVTQRLCSYSRVEVNPNDDTDKEVTRCLETQRRFFTDNKMCIEARLTPESSMGTIFRIETDWTVTGDGPDRCNLQIHGEVECTKRMWGVQNVVESMLVAQTAKTYEDWVTLSLTRARDPSLSAKATSSSTSLSPSSPSTSSSSASSDQSTNGADNTKLRLRTQVASQPRVFDPSIGGDGNDPKSLLGQDGSVTVDMRESDGVDSLLDTSSSALSGVEFWLCMYFVIFGVFFVFLFVYGYFALMDTNY